MGETRSRVSPRLEPCVSERRSYMKASDNHLRLGETQLRESQRQSFDIDVQGGCLFRQFGFTRVLRKQWLDDD